MAGIGRLIVGGFLSLNSSFPNIISANEIYYFIACLSFAYLFLLIFGMRDVIHDKEFEIRREKSGSTDKRTRMVLVIKQGFKVIWAKP